MRGKIRPSAVEIWDNFPIPLQGLPPSDLPFCNIMHIAYELQLIIDPGTFSFNFVLPFEILIGNVPLKISNPNTTMPPNYFESAAQLLPGLPAPNPYQMADNAVVSKSVAQTSDPPTYEECQLETGFSRPSLVEDKQGISIKTLIFYLKKV